ncbi:MAG: SAM-dependent methyltransferase [Confluentimicrobium sp.]|nr:SAM-dependent methyltransferase [Actibacterium sp.]
MTDTPPLLTDRAALEAHRARAARGGVADFLWRAVSDEIDERLLEVNRGFNSVAVVSPQPDMWRDLRAAGPHPQARFVADTDVLDLPQQGHDLVLHLMALHWANDPVGQMVQARRALRPDGLFMAALLGGDTLTELRQCLAEAEVAETGGLSPRVAPMAEIRDMGGLLQRAGFALPVADSLPLTVSYRDAFHLMQDLRAMGETNALASRHRAMVPRAVFARAAALYSQRFGEADGRIRASFELIFLAGWAPDESQQQPLRPGSAKSRLADALKVPETGLDDTPRGS